MRRWFKWLGRIAGAIVVLNIAVGLVFAHPGWAFPYEAGNDRLRFHAVVPLPDDATGLADRVMAALDAGPLPPQGDVYHVYIADRGWRETLFFAPARGAGGVVYAFASPRNVFLSGADFSQDRLLKHGEVISPPRTLTYYLTHEITHLAQLERLGVIAYFRMPREVREGSADFVALGAAGPDVRDAVAALGDGDRLPLMQAHGAYPEFRVGVTDALEGTTLEALIAGTPQ